LITTYDSLTFKIRHSVKKALKLNSHGSNHNIDRRNPPVVDIDYAGKNRI